MTDFVSGEDYLRSTSSDNQAIKNVNDNHSIFSTVPDAFKFGYTSANADEEDAIDEKVGKYEPDLVRKTFGGLNALAKNARDTIETNDPEAVTGNGLGTAQRWADNAANFVGSMLTPVSIASAGLGKAGKIGESVLAAMARREIPSLIEKLPKFVPSLASHAASGALGFAAFDTPSALLHGHNASDVVTDISESGAFGMAVSIVPFLWGQLKGKKVLHGTSDEGGSSGGTGGNGGNSGGNDDDYTPRHTDEEKDFIQKYEANGKKITPDLTEQAKSIATKRGIEFNDVSGKTSVPIIPKNDIENMQHAILDQMNRGLDGDLKNALSDFITAKNLDRLSADDTSINGLRGFVDHVRNGEDERQAHLKEMDADLKENLHEGLEPEQSKQMQAIKDKLLPNDKLLNNFENTKEYRAVKSLAEQGHPNMQRLLKRILQEHEYNKLKAFADMADQLVKLADQKGDTQLADLEKVYNYLQQEPDARKSTLAQEANGRNLLDTAKTIPADIERQLADMINAIVDDEESKKGLMQAADTFKELKASEGVFKNLIGCLIGGAK